MWRWWWFFRVGFSENACFCLYTQCLLFSNQLRDLFIGGHQPLLVEWKIQLPNDSSRPTMQDPPGLWRKVLFLKSKIIHEALLIADRSPGEIFAVFWQFLDKQWTDTFSLSSVRISQGFNYLLNWGTAHGTYITYWIPELSSLLEVYTMLPHERANQSNHHNDLPFPSFFKI